MKKHSALFLALPIILLFFIASCGESNEEKAVEPSTATSDSVLPAKNEKRIAVLDPEALAFIDTTAQIEKLGGGYHWTEGPLYIEDGDYFIFSDVPANKVFKWKQGQGISLYLDSSGYSGKVPKAKEPGSNGLTLDNKKRLVLTQQGDRRIARMIPSTNSPAPKYQVIVDRFEGKRFNSPNDLIYSSHGDLYFTDPPYGLEKGDEDSSKELSFHGVYRVRPNGKIDLVTKEFPFPNGLALTPDEKYLLVAHSDDKNKTWMKYELDKNGLVKSKSVFYKISEEEGKDAGAPDGFKISKKGYVFASGPGGVWIFNPAAKPIARIYTGGLTANCALSSDEKTLFLTCDDDVCKVNLK